MFEQTNVSLIWIFSRARVRRADENEQCNWVSLFDAIFHLAFMDIPKRERTVDFQELKFIK